MEKIKVRYIFEILGRPAPHIKESLALLLERIGKEPGVKILESDIKEPIAVQDSKDLFTTFAEVTAELDNLDIYFGLIFAYLPSNTEVISPDSLILKKEPLTIMAHRLTSRMHDYDAIAKKMIGERDFLVNKLREVAPHLFKDQKQTQQSKPSLESAVKEETKENKKEKKAKKSKIKK